MGTSTKKSKLNKTIVILSILIAAVFVVIVCWQLFAEAWSPVLKTPKYDEVLSPKVSTYLTERTSSSARSTGTYDSYGNLSYGPSETYCDSAIYGYDENYIYAIATCHSYSWFYHYQSMLDDGDTIRITRSVSRDGGWSSHVRLSYKSGSDFEITGYEQPGNGNAYHDDLMKIFAPMLVAEREVDPQEKWSSRDMQEIFRSEHANDPYPDKIDRIYTSRNPKIVIGGEVE